MSYHTLRNEITREVNQAHENYQNIMFDSQTDTHHKKFWRYIKKLRKDQTEVTSLTVDGVDRKVLHNSKDKAEALNKQFYCFY